jgi:hypothetical protein
MKMYIVAHVRALGQVNESEFLKLIRWHQFHGVQKSSYIVCADKRYHFKDCSLNGALQNTTKFMEKAKLQVLGLLKTPCIWTNPQHCLQYSHLDETIQVVCATSNTHIWIWQCELYVQLQVLTFGSDNVSCKCNFKYSHLDLTMWVACTISLLKFGSDNVSCICGNDILKKTRQTIWMMAKNGKTKHSLNQKNSPSEQPQRTTHWIDQFYYKEHSIKQPFQDEREERESN